MKKSIMAFLIVCIVLLTGVIAIAASSTLITPGDASAHQISPEGRSAKFVSIRYWVDGLGYAVPDVNEPTTWRIDVNRGKLVTFQVKAKYMGPDGTKGELYMNELTDWSVIESYKVIPPGKVSTLTAVQAWTMDVPGKRNFMFYCNPADYSGSVKGVEVNYY